MAIVKMKHLRLMAMQSDREELLHLLQRMGCVEIDEPPVDESDPAWEGLTPPSGGGLSAALERRSAGERALETLKRYAPEKGGLLHARPEMKREELFEPERVRQARQGVQEVNQAQQRISQLQAQRVKLTAQRAALEPWLSLDVPLDIPSTREVHIQFGTVPGTEEFSAVEQAVTQASPLAQLQLASASREALYLLLVCHASAEQDVMEALKGCGWSRANLREWTGSAGENSRRLEAELAQIDRELAQQEQALAGMGDQREAVKQEIDRAAAEVSREEARGRLLDTRSTFFLEGWVPAERWEELRQALSQYPCACQAEDPSEEEFPSVPVQLKNNWFTKPLNMVTDMYALPAYGSVDPNPLMAPFFILFYGMMMADMGYGLLMILVSLVVIKKTKPNGATMRYMMPLMGLCGVSTFLWGAVTGGFFGDLIPQIVKLYNPDSTFALPALFSPLDDALAVLIGSLALGVVQIFTGMAVSMYRKIKQGNVMQALCEEGAWYLVFLLAGGGIALGQAKWGLTAALAVIVLTQGYGKKGIGGKLMGIGGSLYNNITGYFSDILSYSRLMALMLAGAVIAQVFNTLGAITGNIFFLLLISMIGNALNFALNLLGCFVHDMRLQCLEYFGRFYEDGGKPFRPLNIDTKNVDIV